MSDGKTTKLKTMKAPRHLKVFFLIISLLLSSQSTTANIYVRTAIANGVIGTSQEFQERQTKSACCFYVWDVASAVKYHWCVRLYRENLYEGRGGKMFLRIRPGSILEALYPMSRHSPDRCIFCGRSFQDHLEKWWEPKLNSPYDTHLNVVHTKGVSVLDGEEESTKTKSRRKSGSTHPGGRKMIRFAFHETYVDSVEFETSGEDQKFQQGRKDENRSNEKSKNGQIKSSKVIASHDGYDIRKTLDGTTYRVPTQPHSKMTNKFSNFASFLLREVLLINVEEILLLERIENRSNEYN
mmetsp:Transcript_26364/g.38821  ORF Transcript_26364/g.38821 Transcript_26364/m.38821 type:complete len:297 (-) Transcript_26364:245-1135(-)